MVERNKEVLLKANSAVSQGANEAFLSFCTDDTVWTFVGEQVLTGKEAVRQYMAEQYVEPPVFEVETLVGEGDTVVATGKISLKDKEGQTNQFQYCDIWQFKEGKMHELKAFVLPVEEENQTSGEGI